MQVNLRPVGSLPSHVFVVVVAFDGDRLVLCRHQDRSSWETPGGHIEPGESADHAARRELLEEAGIVPASLDPVADYDVDGVPGRVFVAEVGTRSRVLRFEIAETLDVSALPDDLTYPEIAPTLVRAATEWRRTRGLDARRHDRP